MWLNKVLERAVGHQLVMLPCYGETPCYGGISCGMVIVVWYGMDGMVVTIWGPLATLLVRSADQQNGLPALIEFHGSPQNGIV